MSIYCFPKHSGVLRAEFPKHAAYISKPFPLSYRGFHHLPVLCDCWYSITFPYIYLKSANKFFSMRNATNGHHRHRVLLGTTGLLMLQLPLSFRFLVFTRVHLDAARMENSRLLGH